MQNLKYKKNAIIVRKKRVVISEIAKFMIYCKPFANKKK